MKMVLSVVLVVAMIVTAHVNDAYGGWGGGSCPPATPVWGPGLPQWQHPSWFPPYRQAVQPDKTLGWHQQDQDWWALWEGPRHHGRQLGCWSVSKQTYRPLIDGDFGEPCEPPCGVPEGLRKVLVDGDKAPRCCCRPACDCGVDCQCLFSTTPPLTQVQAQIKIEEEVSKDYGVDFNRLKKNLPDSQFRKGGPGGVKDVTRSQVIEDLARDGGLADDSGKFHVLVVGAEMLTAQVKNDWNTHPKLSQWKDKAHLQCYAPDHWRLAQYPDLPKGGNPSIYFADPRGKKIAEWPAYQGPEWLADVLLHPDKKPEPQPAPPDGAWWPWLRQNWMLLAAFVVIAVLAYLAFFRGNFNVTFGKKAHS